MVVIAVLLGTIGVATLSKVKNLVHKTIDVDIEFKDLNRKIHVSMLEARRSEKDFIRPLDE